MSESYQSADIGMDDPAPSVALTAQRVKRNLNRFPGYVGSITDACALIDRQAARVAELAAENARLAEQLADATRDLLAADEALDAAARWHDSERKALGKQPPNADRDWRRTQHSLQAEEIRGAKQASARPIAPATEQEEG